jgi:dihydrofolate synthase/folylpolyglutamate synthase
MTFDEALSYLLSLGHETLAIKLGLKNTETLLDALGNPHKSFLSVQIAGTNGKGSTAVMLDSICRAAKIRTGLFTSPHLVSITERIKINGEPISEDDFARLMNEVKTTAEQLVQSGKLETLPTFFEHVTAIALLAFREAGINLAVLETGLGGRLDSTTAAHAEIVAITQVAMDHEEYLGHTIEEIAAEKAAIIRPGVTAVIAPQAKEATRIIRRRCEDVGVTPRIVEHQPDAYPLATASGSVTGRLLVTFATMDDVYEDVRLGLRGRHQTDNAAVAIALAEALRERGFAISRAAIIEGLENAKHPGRLELWEGKPPILFDGAHNPAAAHALRQYLDEFVARPITMIFGAMRDKRLSEMADILFSKADQLILTQIDNPRAASLEELGAAAPPNFDRSRIRQATSIEAALQSAYSVTVPENLILVTGSLYLVGAAQQILRATTLGVAHRRAPH